MYKEQQVRLPGSMNYSCNSSLIIYVRVCEHVCACVLVKLRISTKFSPWCGNEISQAARGQVSSAFSVGSLTFPIPLSSGEEGATTCTIRVAVGDFSSIITFPSCSDDAITTSAVTANVLATPKSTLTSLTA